MSDGAAFHVPLFGSHVHHEADAPIVCVEGLSVSYRDRRALEEVGFELKRGERVAVLGPNGAGKSTLFKALAGLLDPERGSVKVFGHSPRGHFCIAYVVQRSQVDWTFPLTVGDVVMMGRISEIGPFRRARARDRAFVRQCLELVGIADLEHRAIDSLSGGQQQRMFIARALAQEAALMLMDEPFTGLDMNTQRDLLELMAELSRRGVTIMLSTHDLNLAAEHFDRVMLLNRRLIGFDTPETLYTPERIAEVFGGATRPLVLRDGKLLWSDTCCGGGAHGPG